MPIPIVPHDSHAARPAGASPAIVGGKVELQLFTTLACNLRCSYCSEAVGDVRGSDGHVSYSFEELERFVAAHLYGLDVLVTFYGGEPTMNIPFMERVVERFPRFRYQLQTNGTLLHRLSDELCSRLDSVLVSVDGGRDTTDAHRGRGVFNRVMRNVDRVRGRVRGCLTARVTWGNAATTLEELDALLGTFDYLYFQFAHHPAGYDADGLALRRAVLASMIETFFSRPGLWRAVPLMGIVRNKLRPELAAADTSGLAQCRVSTHIVNVLPDGNIYPCPDMAWAPELRQGNVRENWLKRSELQPHDDMPCKRCEAFSWCRYNCMKNLHLAYVRGDTAYREAVVDPICELVRFMGREVDRHHPGSWFDAQPQAVKDELLGSPVYEYVEVMP